MDNKKDTRFSFRKRIDSFIYAFNGLRILFKEEHNARIHLVVALFVVGMGFFCDISAMEWIALCFAIGLVIAMEIMNSAIENLSDFASQEHNLLIKKAKDLGAAAVLVCAVVSIIVGLIIFVPKIFLFFSFE